MSIRSLALCLTVGLRPPPPAMPATHGPTDNLIALSKKQTQRERTKWDLLGVYWVSTFSACRNSVALGIPTLPLNFPNSRTQVSTFASFCGVMSLQKINPPFPRTWYWLTYLQCTAFTTPALSHTPSNSSTCAFSFTSLLLPSHWRVGDRVTLPSGPFEYNSTYSLDRYTSFYWMIHRQHIGSWQLMTLEQQVQFFSSST